MSPPSATEGLFVVNFEKYHMPSNIITIPKNWLLLRAASQYINGLNHTNPLFLGSMSVAQFYHRNNPSKTMEAYKTKTSLRLLDVRYFQMLLPIIFKTRGVQLNKETLIFYKTLSAIFGGCTLQKQYDLLVELAGGRTDYEPFRRLLAFINTTAGENPLRRHREVSPIEPMGYRVGITDFDYQVIDILRTIFLNVDGFIAPKLFSPAHNQSQNNTLLDEVILFRPASGILEPLPFESLVGVRIPEKPIQTFFNHTWQMLLNYTNPDNVYIGNGGKTNTTITKPKQNKTEDAENLAFIRDRDAYEKELSTSKRLQARSRTAERLGRAIRKQWLASDIDPIIKQYLIVPIPGDLTECR